MGAPGEASRFLGHQRVLRRLGAGQPQGTESQHLGSQATRGRAQRARRSAGGRAPVADSRPELEHRKLGAELRQLATVQHGFLAVPGEGQGHQEQSELSVRLSDAEELRGELRLQGRLVLLAVQQEESRETGVAEELLVVRKLFVYLCIYLDCILERKHGRLPRRIQDLSSGGVRS